MKEWMVANRRRAFRVVDDFEATLAEYTGAPYVVTVDSCTNALFLSFLWARHARGGWYEGERPWLCLPRKTYVGVAQAARNAGYAIRWHSREWVGMYGIQPIGVVDSAKRFTSQMYAGWPGTLMCVSFQAGKLLPIGRGGAVLTDDAEAAKWLRRARFDGRTEGARCDEPDAITTPGWHLYMSPPDAARGLWLMTYLPEHQDDQVDTYDDLSTLEAFR
jgi:dTDP-4-amino-4,6-dideoxygalactose transaminase